MVSIATKSVILKNWVVTINNNENLDLLQAMKTFIRKKLGNTVVSAIKASSVTL